MVDKRSFFFEKISNLTYEHLDLLNKLKINKKLFTGRPIYMNAAKKTIFIGEIEDDLPNDKGLFIIEDKFTVVISVEAKQGRKHGSGTVYHQDGSYYHAKFNSDDCDGVSDVFSADGAKILTANFLTENTAEIYYHQTGELYCGENWYLKRHGFGKQYKDRSQNMEAILLNGQFEHDLFVKGFAKLDFYVGDVSNMIYNGHGVEYYDKRHTKKRLEGTFRNGLLEGNGIEYHEDAANTIKYEGQFQEGTYEGEGYYCELQPQIKYYKGKFKKGVITGQGEIWDASKRITEKVVFRDGKPFETREIFYYDLVMPSLVELTDEEIISGTITTQVIEKVCYVIDLASVRFYKKASDKNPIYIMPVDQRMFNVRYESVLNEGGAMIYSGFFKEIMLQGKGTLRYSLKNQPRKYNGEFKGSLFDGMGDLHYPTGQVVYSGMFKENKFNGEGKLIISSVHMVDNKQITDPLAGYFGREKFKVEVEGMFDMGTFVEGFWNYVGSSDKVLDKKYLIKVKQQQKDKSARLFGKMFEKKILAYEGSFDTYTFNGKGTLYYQGLNQVKYAGNFHEGYFHGEGTLADTDGAIIYEGTFDMGYYHGMGRLCKGIEDNMFYEGEFVKGVIQGKGKMFESDGKTLRSEGHYEKGVLVEGFIRIFDKKTNKLVYEGGIKRGKYEGEGTLYTHTGQVTEKGIFKDGKLLKGHKRVFFNDGINIEIEGGVENGEFEGKVTEYYFNGNVLYEGNYSAGKKNGEGIVYHRNGKLKQKGTFKDDVFFEGDAIYYWEDNVTLKFKGRIANMYYNGYGEKFYDNGYLEYAGNYKNGQSDGEGIYYYEEVKDKIKYKGTFQEGRPDGQGEIYELNGTLTYKGGIHNWFKHGEGVLYYPTGEVHMEGHWEEDVLVKGRGKLYHVATNAVKYEGEMSEGLADGQGKSYHKNGKLEYEGTWKGNSKDGKGVLYSDTGKVIYEGSFVKGKYHGHGKSYEEDGSYYEGNFVAGKKNGDGLLYYPGAKEIKYEGRFENDGFSKGKARIKDSNGKLVYEGQYAAENYVGTGILYYPNGTVKYQGDFKKSLYAGNGKLFSENGELIYEGGFTEGLYQGPGTLYGPGNQKIYEGDFSRGSYSGPGTKYYSDGKTEYQGHFLKGEMHGEGIWYYSNGFPRAKGTFENGLLVGKCEVYNEKVSGVLKYTGEFLNGKLNGIGEKWSKEGKLKYKGSFKDGIRDGDGEAYNKEGKLVYKGMFKGGKMEGEGVLYYPSGNKQYEGEFRNGVFHGKGKQFADEAKEKLQLDGHFYNGKFTGK